MDEAIYRPEGERFLPTAAAGGPWADGFQHGGPPAGLLARTVETFAGEPDMLVSRLTVDLLRPVPMQPLTPTARTVRAGRRIHVVEAALLADGVVVSQATALLRRQSEGPEAPGGGHFVMPSGPAAFPSQGLSGGLRGGAPPRPGFHTTVEVRWAHRPGDAEPGTAWFRLPQALVDGEEWTPFQRAAATADFVNVVAGVANMQQTGVGYINADSTIYLHRLPEGEWIGLQSVRAVESHGLGVSRATIFDERGPVGIGVKEVIANRRR
jgi:hypothetical protein